MSILSPCHDVNRSFASGGWSPTTAHQSNLYPSPYTKWSASGAAEAYISRGVPAEKIFIGAPFYSRGFAGSGGLGTPGSGPSPDKSWEDGVVDYKSLPLAGAVEMYDEAAQASYSYDANRRVFNSYDNPRAVKAKCDYIKQKGLAGLIIWESKLHDLGLTANG
jgi:chitinase